MNHLRTRLLDLTALGYHGYLKLAKASGSRLRQKCIDLASLWGDETVLDAGCGPGNLSLDLCATLRWGTVNACDISPRMIQIAGKAAEEAGFEIDFEVASVTGLPYEDSVFDVVFTSLVFHHLDQEEKQEATLEISRVMKAGGKYVSAELDSMSSGRIKRFVSMGPRTLDPAHLQRAGMEIVHESWERSITFLPTFFRVAVLL